MAAKPQTQVIEDPFCSPSKPITVTFAEVTSASFKIKSSIIKTSCSHKPHLSEIAGMEVYLKKDFAQITGSFKERGASYALQMLSNEKKKKGVISASAGNHALAMCYHGNKLNVPVTVVMPVVAPIMKIESCRRYGAKVFVEGNDMKEAKDIALKKASEMGMTYINGYDHPHIIAGQGTLGLEIVEQVPDMDAVIVPVGGGGLIAGVALAVKSLLPNVKVYGVESDNCAGFGKAMEVGRPSAVPVLPTLADGLAVPVVGYNAFATAKNYIDKMVVVKEDWIAVAILRLVEIMKCVVEGAGACGLAAILSGVVNELKGKKVVVILSGGNIDSTILGRVLERGLRADGRLVKFNVIISERPGSLAELCKLLGDIGVTIKDLLHERAWVMKDVFSVQIKLVCETRDMDHTMELLKKLKESYTVLSCSAAPLTTASKTQLLSTCL